MAKNLISGPNLGPKIFFSWILHWLNVRHCCKLSLHAISRKINEPNRKKWQKTLAQKCFHKFYFYYMLDIVASYHCMQFQGKLMNQTWENSKKPIFGPDFGPFSPDLGHEFVFSKTWLRQSLEIMIRYHHVQCQKN